MDKKTRKTKEKTYYAKNDEETLIMLKNDEIKAIHKNYRKIFYKRILQYILISVENRVKENNKIKSRFKDLIEENAGNYKLINLYKKAIKEARIDWVELENFYKYQFTQDSKNKMLNINLHNQFTNTYKEIFPEIEHDLNNGKLISNKILFAFIGKIVKWCIKNYNRLSQIKKRKRANFAKWIEKNEDYFKDYYINNKSKFKEKYENNKMPIKSRAEINQEFNAIRHTDSKSLVLEYALKMLANNEKLTIRALNTTLKNANQKLGTTQISLYLKELKSEGLINE